MPSAVWNQKSYFHCKALPPSHSSLTPNHCTFCHASYTLLIRVIATQLLPRRGCLRTNSFLCYQLSHACPCCLIGNVVPVPLSHLTPSCPLPLSLLSSTYRHLPFLYRFPQVLLQCDLCKVSQTDMILYHLIIPSTHISFVFIFLHKCRYSKTAPWLKVLLGLFSN